jgi:hypothetical protein
MRFSRFAGADRSRGRLLLFVVASLVIGALLRFGWLGDMEYKGDERWTFDRSQRIPALEAWPTFGMPSSVGLLNPGLSVWVFVVLAKLFRADDPVALARTVVVCNVAAFVVLFFVVQRAVPDRERDPWLWGIALAAVNPIAMVLERKIWPPCVFPIFCVLFLAGWLRRDRWWGAAVWGLVGAALGQIQMSGFFWAAAFVAWELAFGRLRAPRPKTKWWAWVAGSAVGSIPLAPWVRYLVSKHGYGTPYDWGTVLELRVFRYWLSDTFGLGLDYHLGRDYKDFLRYAPFGPASFCPALYLQALSVVVGAVILASVALALWRALRSTRTAWLEGLRRIDETAFTCTAAFVGFGLLLNFLVVLIHPQYTEVTFPLEWVALASVALAYAPLPRRLLAILWVSQLALSLTFLSYIHVHGGAIHGDYGRAYQAQ